MLQIHYYALPDKKTVRTTLIDWTWKYSKWDENSAFWWLVSTFGSQWSELRLNLDFPILFQEAVLLCRIEKNKNKNFKYVAFPSWYNLFMDCAGYYFVEKPKKKKTIFLEFYLTGLPASFKLPVRKQQSSSGPIASDYLTYFPPLLYFFP